MSRPLVRVARLKTDRTPVEIRGPDGGSLAETTDDRVTVYGERGRQTGSFREIEIEVYAQGRVGRRLMRAAIRRLVAAGCRAEPPIPKVLRALGQPASGPPDVVVPPIGADATVSTLIRYATSRSVTQILRHDPGVRLGEDPEDVHQFRVATRRLRSDLRTFAPLLDPEPASEVRGSLRPLGARAGAARDTDVLADRLKATVDMLPEQDAVRPGRPAGRRSGRQLDPATLATAETRRQGPRKALTRPSVARRPHPGQAMPLRGRGRRTGLRPPGQAVRRVRRRGPGHPRRSPRHRCRRGMAAQHGRRSYSRMRRGRRTDHFGAPGTGQAALEVAEGLETRIGPQAAPLAGKRPSPHRTPAEHPRSVARRATPRPNGRGRAGPLPSLNLPRGSCRESRACLVIPASGDPSPKGR